MWVHLPWKGAPPRTVGDVMINEWGIHTKLVSYGEFGDVPLVGRDGFG